MQVLFVILNVLILNQVVMLFVECKIKLFLNSQSTFCVVELQGCLAFHVPVLRFWSK